MIPDPDTTEEREIAEQLRAAGIRISTCTAALKAVAGSSEPVQGVVLILADIHERLNDIAALIDGGQA